MPKITLAKDKKTIECEEGAILRDVLLKNGVDVYAGINKRLNCGGHGNCGTCRVYIKEGMDEGASPPGLKERLRSFLAAWTIHHEDEVRLSCQTRVLGDMTVQTTPDFNWFGQDTWKYTTRPVEGARDD